MVQIRQKMQVQMKLSGTGETHARSQIHARDVTATIDEPEARGGTNQGLSPTETLMSALIGCTNVVSKRIAHGMGLEMGEMQIDLTAAFDRRGVMLAEEVEQPFSDIVLDIRVATNATPEELAAVQTELAKYCPIAKVIRGGGVTITENWTATPL